MMFYLVGEKKLGVSVTQDTWKAGSRSHVGTRLVIGVALFLKNSGPERREF